MHANNSHTKSNTHYILILALGIVREPNVWRFITKSSKYPGIHDSDIIGLGDNRACSAGGDNNGCSVRVLGGDGRPQRGSLLPSYMVCSRCVPVCAACQPARTTTLARIGL